MANEFHHANLRGSDFRGKNCTGADFSYADIRGTDFRNAILVGANFSNARAGLPISCTIGLVALLLIQSLSAGLISAYAGAIISDLLSTPINGTSSFGILSLITIAMFLAVIIWQGIDTTLAILTEIVAVCLTTALVFVPDYPDVPIIGIVFTTLAIPGAMAGIINMAIVVAVGRVMGLPKVRVFTGFPAVIGAMLGVILGVRIEESAPLETIFVALFVAGLVALVAIALGIYIGWQAITGNPKYWLIRSLAIAIVAKGGTNFRGANLTDVDFRHTTLKSVDFRQATLTRTCWFRVQKLAQARVEGTYLADAKVRKLVTTKDGREQNFDNLNLRGLNLKDANLQDASLINTDLSEATLQNANLFGAKLVQAQLYQTILKEACLTGAYIENWGISTDTQLDGVKCEYIYMQFPTKDDPDPCRKPDNRKEIFAEGDFADFIAPIIKTLDLYQTQNVDMRQLGSKFHTLDLFHHQGIDPQAAAIAVIQVAVNYPEAKLEVVAIEGQGKEKIRLQAKVAGDANRSQLSTEYFAKYAEIKSLPSSDLQTLLVGIAEKDDRIRSLERLLENALQQPKFYVETQHTQGDMLMSQSKGNINLSGAQGNISGVAAAGESGAAAAGETLSMTGAIGEVSGNVTNTISQLPDAPEPDKPGIKELLTELQAAIEADPNLSEEDKTDALEQVQALAEAGQKPEDGAMQKLAKRAIKFLKGTIADLPSTVDLVKTCSNLFPIITEFFGW
ncbi:MAG: low-complexity protein [Symploca sp. SIO1B1]|nr:low-complexity protein [Symploca sp. SIO1B1]